MVKLSEAGVLNFLKLGDELYEKSPSHLESLPVACIQVGVQDLSPAVPLLELTLAMLAPHTATDLHDRFPYGALTAGAPASGYLGVFGGRVSDEPVLPFI
nr:hypothetical protein HmN_000897400 [Hymenolepis microstoma]